MIEVEEALHIINANTKSLGILKLKLNDALSYTLAQDIISPSHMPPFNQSAMDGFALNYQDNLEVYDLIGEVKAGQEMAFTLNKGEAVRIFTGAPVPDSATTVIQQEWVKKNENKISFLQQIADGKNIRPRGEQIQKGKVALVKGTRLNPAALGYLASIGVDEVTVYELPKIAIVVTGDELIKPGKTLRHGQIFESNALMLASAVREKLFPNPTIHQLKDDFQETYSALQSIIASNDIVVVSGGISVGDYDFVGKALQKIGVRQHFYKVNQKPGKPLYFGTYKDKVIFGLPGNPAASLTCFYIYGLLALNNMAGNENSMLAHVKIPLDKPYTKKGKRAEFLKARIEGNTVSILDHQSSAMLNSFAMANALVYLPEAKNEIQSGELVLAYLIG